MEKKLDKSNLNLSLPKALQILEVLVENPNGMALSDIVKSTGLNKSLAYRMLQTMQKLEYVESGAFSGSYRPTFKIVTLGQKIIYGTNIVQIALPDLTALNSNLRETVNLKIFREDHSVILLKLEPPIGQVRTQAYIGMKEQLYLSATGKVFLAYRSESFAREYWQKMKIQGQIKKVTPFTITELPILLERLNSVREYGYALDLGENEYAFACIAAPIFDYTANVSHAVSITLTTTKLQMSSIETFAKPLLKTVQNISLHLGYKTCGSGNGL